MSKLPIIGISLGDMNGISPEIIIKSLADNRLNQYCCPVLYASPKVVSYWRKIMNMNDFNLFIANSIDQINHKRSNVLVCWDEEVEIKPGEATETAGKYALKSLERAAKDAIEGKIHGLVTAPLNKKTIGNNFTGHTSYLANLAKAENPLMLMISEQLKLGLVTEHLALSQVSANLNRHLITEKLDALYASLQSDFAIDKPRIAVLALNPHAGENGLLGKEEMESIKPAIDEARATNKQVFGPYPADGFFGSMQYRKFDAVLAMYHDQGLMPFKFISYNEGVNFTAGLPFVRTSPAHGTAYDIAGKNEADESSMRNAIYATIDLISRRKMHEEISHNPLPFTPLRRERFKMDFTL